MGWVASFLLVLLLGDSSCSLLANAKQFQDMSFAELSKLVRELEGPFASVQAADELWGLASLKSAQCSAQVVRVTDIGRLQTPPPFSPEFLRPLRTMEHPLPQVVISGEIHGNERVGPSSSLFTAQLLVWAGLCAIKHSEAHCAHLKQKLYMSDEEVTWLAFLATRRDTFVLPAPNCQGYARNVRGDQGIDTNRDFSYAREDDKCFMSTTAKIFQALFSTVSVQILVTFHGGMVALGYEWGSMDHPRGKDLCPDHAAHRDIAESMARFGGSFKRAKSYRAKPINSIVYPVFGGMEDWAYAAGWDTVRVRADCQGYKDLPATQRAPLDETKRVVIPNNRAVTFLVETSDRKGPTGAELGSDQHVLLNEKASNEKHGGHVPRNTRLALAAIDLVEPYVCFSPLGNVGTGGGLTVQWYVGGAHEVDSTWLEWHRFIPSAAGEEGGGVRASQVLQGKAKWALDDPLRQQDSRSPSQEAEVREGQFVASVLSPPASILSGSSGRTVVLWLVAHAVVDQKWGLSGQGYPRDLSPQSHLVQLRTNASYQASAFSSFDPTDVRLRGRPGNEWLSDAIEVEVEVGVPSSRSGSSSDSGEEGSEGGGDGKERNLRVRGRGKRAQWSMSRRSRNKGLGDRGGGEEREEEGRAGAGKVLRIKSKVDHCAWWTRTLEKHN